MPEELSRDRALIPLYDLVVVMGLNDRGAIWIGHDQRDDSMKNIPDHAQNLISLTEYAQ